VLSASPPLQKQSIKVLIVNGDSNNGTLLLEILNSLAIKDVLSLSNYQNFISHFFSFMPDLIILDLNASCGSAESIIEWVRTDSIKPSLPILVSATSQHKGIRGALKMGVNDYIQTPYVSTKIAIQINNLIQKLISGVPAESIIETELIERENLKQGSLGIHSQDSLMALQAEVSQRNKIEQELHFQAHHEYHSRLPNRVYFQNVLARMLADSSIEATPIKTIVIFHLHQFNKINNTLGHSRADEILVEMAHRFAKLSEKYTEVMTLQCETYEQAGKIALLDRTHFTIVLDNVRQWRIEEIIDQLLTQSSQPLQYQGMQIETPISVGFASSIVGDDIASWMRRAYVALEFAEQEKQLWAGYSEQADRYSKKKLTLVADLRNAIACDQGLFLHYQPQFNCRDGEISGVEVLLRWNHPVYGPLPADEIVTLAEQTGLIQPLTHWVISHAFSQHQKVLAAGFDLSLSVNLSTLNLWQEHLLEDIAQQLEVYEIPPKRLILEVTETVLLEKPGRSLEFLRCVTAIGIRIALDDFGTGFSSLAYLKKMPVSELKIDRAFIQELCFSHEDQVIVKSIISMCQGLGIEVVAEGVENEETQSRLESFGCDRLQGYFLAKPLLGSDLLLRLKNGRD
jgi:EAL domain-containing protein (putative c-di-GMP-specific phosphodiesterase class I)/GGDEF domain-containing protein/DNA-binding NarL/FixJ family response regulator